MTDYMFHRLPSALRPLRDLLSQLHEVDEVERRRPAPARGPEPADDESRHRLTST